MPKKQIPEGLENPDSNVPFSSVLQIGNHFHLSGFVPAIGDDKKPISPDLADQTREVLAKIKNALTKCGLTPNDLFDITIIFLGSNDAYQAINQVYSAWLKDEGVEYKPIRFAYGVSWIPFDASVEIKAVAVKQD
jgi:2-iminobutanoate/2-iminopropanoate deaminase